MIAAVAALALPVAWAGLDLLLRFDLPGAAAIQHFGFRLLVRPLEWLTEGDGHRMRVALGAWVFVVVSAALGEKGAAPKRWVLGTTAGLVVAGEAVTVALALLMERGLGVGIAAGVAVWWWRRDRAAVAAPPSRGLLAFAAVAAAASLYYVYAMFMTYGGGYPLLQALGDLLRGGGTSFFAAWAAGVALLGGVAVALVARSGAARDLVPGVAAAVVVAAILGWLGARAEGSGALRPLVAAVIAGPSGVALVALLGGGLAGVRGPLRWPVLGAVPCVVAGLLFGHTYSARILACPAADDPAVTVLATPGEVFRIARGASETTVLSLREDRKFGLLHDDGRLGSVVAGPVGGPWDHDGDELFGTPEELVYAPARDVFFATLVPHDAQAFAEGPVVPNNLLVTIAGDGSRVTEAEGIEGLCWINTLHWNDAEGLLYIGCEDRPGLFRYRPGVGIVDGTEDPRLGDVQDLAFGDGTLWTVSLWFSRMLTELSSDDLSIVRQLPIGGTHYHVVADGRMTFASSYYGGRVRVIDDFVKRRSQPAGFGTREVAVDPSRKLLLASGTYDGRIRLFGYESPPTLVPLGSLAVGGHVKDIAVSPEDGKAWTWSQCGLLEIDLEALP